MSDFDSASPDGTLLCVLGMHRSGTSLLAGSLQSAGVWLGEVNESAQHNRKGNRENVRIRTLNDAILARHGYDWKTPPPLIALPLEWTDTEREEGRQCLAALRATSTGAVAGFKDPRTIWTLEGWTSLCPELKRIGVFRPPGPVVASLTGRAGALAITEADALELWRRTNRRLIALVRKDAFPLLHFGSPDLRADFHDPLRAALSTMGLTTAPDFYNAELVHNAEQGLQDAGAACVYAELLRETGRHWP